jgi:hypothetical protein
MEKELSEISAEEFYEPMVQPDLNELVLHKLPFDQEKIKDTYQKKVFIRTLTSGKTTLRKGLGHRLLNLAGFYVKAPDTCLTKCSKGEYDGMLQFVIRLTKHDYNLSMYRKLPKNIEFYLLHHKFKKVCDIFLQNYYIEFVSDAVAYIFFQRKNINWGMLDQALAITLPKNHRKDKNGFVYISASWSKINSLHEENRSFVDYV